jgi:hypothetical protein
MRHVAESAAFAATTVRNAILSVRDIFVLILFFQNNLKAEFRGALWGRGPSVQTDTAIIFSNLICYSQTYIATVIAT